MNNTINYSLNKPQIKNQSYSGLVKVLKDQDPGYDDSKELFDMFENRIKDSVDQERLLPDEYSVAMKIGLCRIENTDEDAITLRNQAWLENGKEEKLKETILEELEKGPGSYRIDCLRELTAEELLGFYRKMNRNWGLEED